ncbi:hypothetical protein STEG23_002718 [Scotinomys teguina]
MSGNIITLVLYLLVRMNHTWGLGTVVGAKDKLYRKCFIITPEVWIFSVTSGINDILYENALLLGGPDDKIANCHSRFLEVAYGALPIYLDQSPVQISSEKPMPSVNGSKYRDARVGILQS